MNIIGAYNSLDTYETLKNTLNEAAQQAKENAAAKEAPKE